MDIVRIFEVLKNFNILERFVTLRNPKIPENLDNLELHNTFEK